MSKHSFAIAWALGLATIAWVGLGFIATSGLALAVTAVIAAAFLAGGFELRRFRAQTAALSSAMAGLQAPPARLADWLEQLPAPLREPVRARVESGRGGLPGPALTPYLVGLLVMLGMLGTFLGMVVTFQGTVFALERSADLQAMRAALAAPIRGLGLSFGTSVAGVAASALLGLMSALSRRERAEAVRRLDACIAGALRPFSAGAQRQATLDALQSQGGALPDLARRLEALMDRIEQRGQQVDAQLLERQSQFLREAAAAQAELGRRVGDALEGSLAAGARAAGDTLAPVVASAMAQVVQQSERLHARLGESAQAQADQLARRFEAGAAEAAQSWDAVARRQREAGEQSAAALAATLAGFNDRFGERSAALLDEVQAALARAQSAQAQAERERLDAFHASLQGVAADLGARWQQAGEQAAAREQSLQAAIDAMQATIARSQATQAEAERQRLAAVTESLQAVAADLGARWQQAGEQAAAREQSLHAAIDAMQAAIAQTQATQAEAERQRLQAFTESLQGVAADLGARWQRAGEQAASREASLQAALDAVHAAITQSQAGQAEAERQRLQAFDASLQAVAADLRAQWQQAGEQAASQQRALHEALARAAQEVAGRASEQAGRTLDQASRLLERSEALVQDRAEAESRWTAEQGQRMDQLAALWRDELAALRREEGERGAAAVQRLDALQAAVGQHLATLGAALEAPMARLMQTAAEVPQAAAGVIAQLREEMGRMAERDNLALQERTELMRRLGVLLESVTHASGEQRAAIEGLVASAADVLREGGDRFGQALQAHADEAARQAVQAGASAVELAAASEAFAQAAQGLQASQAQLAEGLQKVEAAIARSTARSDEQLAYYVAQAREVIDLSIASQQGLVDSLRQLQARPAKDKDKPVALAEGERA